MQAYYIQYIQANANQVNNKQESPLLIATRADNKELVESLLTAGVDVNKGDILRETPLIIASRSGKTDLIKFLLAANADVNISNHERETALSIAARMGYHEIMDLLIQTRKVNINSIDRWEENPLFNAVRSGSLQCVQLLIANNVCLLL